MRRALALVPVLAATVLAASGCGASSSHPSPARLQAKLTRAAYVSATSSGYKMTLSLTEDLGAAGQLVANGSGSLSIPSKSGTVSMSMKIPGIGAAFGQLNIAVIIRDKDYYIRLPSSLASLIPGGKPWLYFNLDQVGAAAGIPGLGSLVSSEQSFSDPTQYLTYLRAVTRNGIKTLGSEKIDGVQTTHYRGDLDLSRLADVVPAADRQAAQKLATALQAMHMGTQPIDVWVDDQNRVRRIVLKYTMQLPGASASGSSTTGSTDTTGSTPQTTTTSLTEDFTDYGPQPVPPAPPANQTSDLLSLLHRAK